MYRALPRPRRRGRSAARRSPTAVDIELDFKKRHFPVFTPPDGKTPEDYLRELCEQGLRERYGDNAAAGGARPPGARAGHHLPHGLRQLLPHRLGLRALRRRERHPGQRPRLGLRRRWSATSSSSATSIRWSTTCCSSASSIPTAARRPTSTSTSARTAARRSSPTSGRSTARRAWPRSPPSAPWPPGPPSRTWAGSSTSRWSASPS